MTAKPVKRVPTKRTPTSRPSLGKPSKTSEEATAGTAGKAPAAPKRALPKRPQPMNAKKKEVVNDVQEEIKELPQVEDTAGAGKEITKPAPSGGGDREERRPGRPSERARGELIAEIIKDNHEVLTRLDDEPGRPNERAEFDRHERQVTVERVQKMTYQERLAMWKELNKGAGQERFITLRKVSDLPKNMAMSKEEAVHRGIIEAKKPAKDALYCPYCVTWMPFVSQPWAGYVRCCGCSMSTMDYYIRAYNDLWK